MSCVVKDSRNTLGYREICLQNDLLSLTVLPERGAEVARLVHRGHDLDVLWKAPWGMRRQTNGETEALWMDGYAGGWQEIFPNGGDPCVYNGALLGFQGEASVSQWEYKLEHASSNAVAAEFSVRLARSPFLLRRRMILQSGQAQVRLEEELTNLGEEQLHCMWGHHPAYGAPFLSGDCRLVAPAAKYLVHGSDEQQAWPVSLTVSPPGERLTAMGYLADLAEGWYELRNARLGFAVRCEWDAATFPYVWVWRELRGSFGYPWYGRCYVMGIEPFTSIPGTGLANAIAGGTAPSIAAGASVHTRLQLGFIAF